MPITKTTLLSSPLLFSTLLSSPTSTDPSSVRQERSGQVLMNHLIWLIEIRRSDFIFRHNSVIKAKYFNQIFRTPFLSRSPWFHSRSSTRWSSSRWSSSQSCRNNSGPWCNLCNNNLNCNNHNHSHHWGWQSLLFGSYFCQLEEIWSAWLSLLARLTNTASSPVPPSFSLEVLSTINNIKSNTWLDCSDHISVIKHFYTSRSNKSPI